MIKNIIPIERLSSIKLLPPHRMPNASAELLETGGIMLGISSQFSVPVFLDLSHAINPHILIVGITGSGKTNLMLHIIMRLAATGEAKITIFDMTGEYARFQDIRSSSEMKGNLEYLPFHNLDERKKVESARKSLGKVISEMRRQSSACKRQSRFIALDEAWKLVSGPELKVILREGRKYGVGIIISSQLITDLEREYLGNISTMLILRTHSMESLEKMAADYSLSEHDIAAIKELAVGESVLIKNPKSAPRTVTRLSRPEIAVVPNSIYINNGGKMNVRINRRKLIAAIESRFGREKTSGLMSEIISSDTIELAHILSVLLSSGFDRFSILEFTRELGIGNADAADAFSYAICR